MEIHVWKEQLNLFTAYLAEREYAHNSIRAYHANVAALLDHLCAAGSGLDKEALIAYKHKLTRAMQPSSANRSIAAINLFLKYLGRPELALNALRVQERTTEEHGLTMDEFTRLMDAALRHGQYKTAMIMLTLAQTGIRIGELCFITVEAVQAGRAVVHHKNKIRAILIAPNLQKYLLRYSQKMGVARGAIFVGKTDAPISRSYVAWEMKALAQSCGVDPAKAFPHNLRHYFARRFLDSGNQLTDLADLLGHSKVETTRRYLRASDTARRDQLARVQILQHPLQTALQG